MSIGESASGAETAGRYERKFLIKAVSPAEVELLIKLHPVFFREIYHARYVNNIYFDTYALESYFEALDGVERRTKTRIRWYGDLFGFIESPSLELKHKHGAIGWKEIFAMQGFDFGEPFDPSAIRQALAASKIPGTTAARTSLLEPALVDRYLRRYFLSACGRFRITVDSRMEFIVVPARGGRFTARHAHTARVVLELKYDKADDVEAVRVGSFFPFGLERFSKYTDGLEVLDTA